ncbi:MAG: hypothetical protein J6S58_08860 [Lentisphaeria bacterium]|nr:hypothetical protein [Lentisphaeria bacterium]
MSGEDLYSIYKRARGQIKRRLSTFLQRKNASFTGPQLVSLFDDLQKIFPEMEEQYCSVYEETLSFMAKQNYAAFLHDMGREENVDRAQECGGR